MWLMTLQTMCIVKGECNIYCEAVGVHDTDKNLPEVHVASAEEFEDDDGDEPLVSAIVVTMEAPEEIVLVYWGLRWSMPPKVYQTSLGKLR